eukprot:TRINITY_DN558_c2_g1_i1.p1 TRINITY_DN558_c2_g1~~TRINITY_DN558_c2_g1_i1.p1  ORF type:complete len:143 (+),score=36.32 TRINITY_DN558_c2_g1_i1:54-482(+)
MSGARARRPAQRKAELWTAVGVGALVGSIVTGGIVAGAAAAMFNCGEKSAEGEKQQAWPTMMVGRGAERREVSIYKAPPRGYTPAAAVDDDACVVCMTYAPDTTVFNCGHLHLCHGCVAQLQKAECPSCRAPIDAIGFNYRA